MIYLWTNETGWEQFDVTDKEELAKRNILIGDSASIGNGAIIGDSAFIGDSASIGNGAFIGNHAFIGDSASIGNGASPQVIYIIGSRFPVSYWGENRIDIGCKSMSIDDWFNKGIYIAEKEHFTETQITEYKGYINFIKSQYGIINYKELRK